MQLATSQDLKQGFKVGQDVADKVSHTVERFNNRLTLANPRFIERYLSGDLHILINLVGWRMEEYIAHFQRLPLDILPTEVSGAVNEFRGHETDACKVGKGVDAAKSYANCDQQTVFTDSVEHTETPKKVIPSLVRFGRHNSVLSGLGHQLYFSCRVGFIFLRSIKNRKRGASVRLVSRCDNELVGKVVKGRPQIRQDITGNKGKRRGDFLDLSHDVLECPRLRVSLGVHEIGVGFHVSDHSDFLIADVLFGPFNLEPDGGESVHNFQSITDSRMG